MAGLDITRESGQAGSGVKMQLRGNRSFQKDSGNPLFIIDGMPGDYSTLNPNDIESIEVLKRCFFDSYLWFKWCERCYFNYY